ncbi:hypothetical protein D9M70_334230 [compost metagenome]
MAEVFHGTIDQLAAVIGGDDLHPGRQAFLQLIQLGLDRGDGLAGVLATAQDHHATDRLTLTVEFGDPAAHLRPLLDGGHIAEGDRHAANAELERHGTEVVQGLQVPRGAHHVFGFGHRQHGSAGFLVGLADGLDHRILGDPQAGQSNRIELHLVLLDHAAHGRHFGDVGQGLQLELEKPVLQGAQLRQVVPAAAIHQRVLVDPADSGGVRPQRRLGGARQAALDLAEVLQHPRAGPVQVGTILEDHVDKAVTEEGIATHRLRAGH